MREPPTHDGPALDSWKAIAAYLNRTVRTVQRWEREQGLPVHRHVHNKLGSVYASRFELDAWISRKVRTAEREFSDTSPEVRDNGTTAPQRTSVLIMPLRDLSPEHAHATLCEGMADELAATLGRLPSVQVSSGVIACADRSTVSARSAAASMGFRHILDGSVRLSGSKFRVHLALSSVADGRQCWVEQFDIDEADAVSVQQEIAQFAAQALTHTQLQAPPRLPRNSSEFEAYRLLQISRERMSGRTLDSMKASIELAERAVRLAPHDALGYAANATAKIVLASYGASTPGALMKAARTAALNALRVEAELAAAHRSRGAVALFYEWDWPEAGRELETAIGLDPTDASARQMLSIWHLAMNRPRDALVASRTAEALQPAAAILAANTGWLLYFGGRFSESVSHLEALIRRQPQFWRAYINLAWALTATGRAAEAIQPIEVGAALHPNYATVEAVRAYVYASAGHRQIAAGILTALDRRYRYVSSYWKAIVRLAMGQVDRAFTDLRRAADDREWYLITANWEPAFDSIRADDRFQAVLHRVALPRR